MRKTLLLIAIAMFFIWGLGVCAFSATGLIHLVLVVAVIAFVLWLMSSDDDRYIDYRDDYHNEINY